MNRINKIIAFLLEIIFTYITLFSNIKLTCISKLIFKTSCPACGLIRAFKSILKLNFVKALNYNILSLVILILLIILNYNLIYDIIANTKKTNKYLTKLGKYYIIIIILLIISGVINNIKGI